MSASEEDGLKSQYDSQEGAMEEDGYAANLPSINDPKLW